MAELGATAASRRSPLRFALGAPWHALWLRTESWRPSLLATDATGALRQLRRRPGLATAAILTLAVGAGATTAIFSVVYGVLLKPLPYRDPASLVQLWEVNPLFNWTEANIAPGNLLSWRERNHVFEDIAFYFGSSTREGGLSSLTLGGDEPVRVQGLSVSTNFFAVLGALPASGRTFGEGDDAAGRNQILVLSHRFWHDRLGANPNVIDQPLTLNGRVFRVVGVMPADFEFDAAATDFWLPMTFRLSDLREVRRPHYLHAVARLKPGVTLTEARGDLQGIARDLEREFPATNRQMSAGLGPVDDWFVGETRRPLLLFLAAVGLVLLIGCVNVMNLMLARSLERVGEMTLRAALGASQGRLLRQLLVESLIIAGVGTTLGLAIAYLGVRAFVRFAPVSIPRLDQVGLDPATLLFCTGLVVMTTLLIGLAPALWGARSSLRETAGASRTATSGATRVRRWLVGGEIALAVVLVVLATLTLRSFVALLNVDSGLPVASQIVGRVSLPAARYGEAGKASAFFEAAAERLRAMPGVTAAGAAAALPLDGSSWTSQFYIDGRADFHGYELRHKAVTSGYLEALGVRLVSGRTLTTADRPGAPFAIVVNAAFARQYFAGDDPVGHRVAWDAPNPATAWREIVGVVSDEPQDAIGQPAAPELYYSLLQEERREMSFIVRSTWPADRAVLALRGAVKEIDPQLALFDLGSMSARLDRSLAKPRVAAWLVAAFAIVALLLATIGIYGVTAWAVTARSREFAIRIACGAARADVFRLVLWQDLGIVAAGMAVGAGLSAIGARAAASQLFGVTPGDPTSYAIGVIVLFAAGVVACIGPALRAARINPTTMMRY